MTKNTIMTVAMALLSTFSGLGAPLANSKAGDTSTEPASLLGSLRARDRFVYGPIFGSPSGSFSDMRCGFSEWMSAINIAATGSYVDGLGIECSDKVVAGLSYAIPAVGSGAGSVIPRGCPSADLIPTGLYGRSGGVLDRAGLVCRKPKDPADSGDLGLDWGGSGGTSFFNECPRGFWLVGLRIWSGTYISAVQPICRYDP